MDAPLELSPRTAKRLAMLRASAEAAVAVAQAAQAQAETLQMRYKDAVVSLLEANGIDVGERMEVNHDVDKDTLKVGPATPAPNGTAAVPRR